MCKLPELVHKDKAPGELDTGVSLMVREHTFFMEICVRLIGTSNVGSIQFSARHRMYLDIFKESYGAELVSMLTDNVCLAVVAQEKEKEAGDNPTGEEESHRRRWLRAMLTDDGGDPDKILMALSFLCKDLVDSGVYDDKDWVKERLEEVTHVLETRLVEPPVW